MLKIVTERTAIGRKPCHTTASTTLLRLRENHRGGIERMKELQNGKDCCEILSSGNDRAIGHMNSQQLLLPYTRSLQDQASNNSII